METPNLERLRDTAFWINVASIVLSTAAITVQNYPSIPENLRVASAFISNAAGITGILFFGADMIHRFYKDGRVLNLPEIPRGWELIRNRRFQTTLLVFVNVAIQNRLSNMVSIL